MALPAVSIQVRSGDEVDAALRRAADTAAAGARLIEWRIDELASEPSAASATRRLVDESPIPSIVTCRTRSEGGGFDGSDELRGALLATVVGADHPPRYVDIELAAFERSRTLRAVLEAALDSGRDRDVHTSLILSAHDFDRRPKDLLQKVQRMVSEPMCAVIKVAWHARSLRDNLEAFDLLAERRKPMIALCTGRFGLLSRVLAGKFGGLMTYAAQRRGDETASGQPTLDELVNLYRFRRIGPDTRVYGIIGWPAEHSVGPALHNAGFEALGHDGVYLPMPIGPGYELFKATVGAMLDSPRLDFRGASVTSPHKQNLLRFAREHGAAVGQNTQRIGAANTLLVKDDGALECLNTDAPAFREALCESMGIQVDGLTGLRVAVLGAGGVGRAVVAALAEAGARTVVFNRTVKRAEILAAAFNGVASDSGKRAEVAVGEPGAPRDVRFDVIVNCTTIGMAGGPAPARSPLPEGVELGGNVTVFDTVYTPNRTPLIIQAESRGARTICGSAMFLRQAAMQCERWTGKNAPVEVFERQLAKYFCQNPEP